MNKYLPIFFVTVFFLSLFIFNTHYTRAYPLGCTSDTGFSTTTGEACGAIDYSNLKDCSTISGYQLTQGESCAVVANDNTVFNFAAKDSENNNLSWSLDWGDGQIGIGKMCPAFSPSTTFSASHAWTSVGTYAVKLGVSNCKEGGDTAALFNIIVKPISTISSSSCAVGALFNTTTGKACPTFISPKGGEKYRQGNMVKISWTSANASNVASNGNSIRIFKFRPDNDYSKTNPDIGQAIFDVQYNWYIPTNFTPGQYIAVIGNDINYSRGIDLVYDIVSNPFTVISSSANYDFDMTIQKVGTWPTTATQGQSLTFGAKYFNIGTEEDPKFSWLYSGYNQNPNLPGHGPTCLYRTDSTGTHVVSCPTDRSPVNLYDQPVCGNNHYVMKVNAYNDVSETNMNNNEVSGDVLVDCSKKPDFIIEKAGTWPTTVQSGVKPYFNFVEKNIGQAAAQAGVVRMTVNGEYRAGSWPMTTLAPGASTGPILFGFQVSSTQAGDSNWWIPQCKTGDKFTLNICADNACGGYGFSEIDESNENNNILTYDVTCQ